jgi:NTP pyrophosphatase (non-canonical NTP hydrolase)
MNIKDLTREVEKVSQIYSKRFNIERDGDWFILKLQEELGELIQSYLMMIRKGRSKGKTAEEIKDNFRKEVADVFCHVLLLGKFYKIDLEKEVEEKWLKWNKVKKYYA